jgi:hypothetical protein
LWSSKEDKIATQVIIQFNAGYDEYGKDYPRWNGDSEPRCWSRKEKSRISVEGGKEFFHKITH